MHAPFAHAALAQVPAHDAAHRAVRATSASLAGSAAIVWPQPRAADDMAAAASAGDAQLWLLAAGDLAAAQAWARGLASEGLQVSCTALAAADAAWATPWPGAADGPTRLPGPVAGIERHSDAAAAGTAAPLHAIVLHVAEALAPHLAQVRALRSRWPHLPLVAVVRGLRDLDHVLALEMGADDVIDAATATPVVAARVRALWRRGAATLAALAAAGGEREPPRELRFGALHLRRLEREVRLAERPVPLTEGEFEVLWLLASHAGQALSRREILKRVRGLDDQPLDRSIDSRVYRIRAKLGDSHAAVPRIRTVRHQGYAFSPSGW